MTLAFLALLGAPYIYDISSLRVNILGRSVHTMKKNSDALVVYNTFIGLDVNANETQYMVVSRDQNAGRSHSIKIYNISFERWKISDILEQT